MVHTAVDCESAAETIVMRLVEERVAACVTLSASARSTYHWKGRIETANEVALVIKTRLDLFDKVRAIVLENHPYELPEIIATPIVCYDKAYGDWIDESLL